MWAALVVVLYALFASVFTIGKWGLEYADPLFLVGSRMLLAGILMLGYLLLFKRDQITFKKEHFWRIIRLAACNIYLTNALEFWGLKYLPSSKTCFLYSLSPFIAALFSYFMLNERMTQKKWIGLSVGFIGFIPILLQSSSSEENIGQLLYLSWPELAVLGAVVCSVYGWILMKQLCDKSNYSPLMVNGWSMLFGGLLALTNSYFVEPWDPVPVTEYTPFLISGFLLIIISNMICYNLYGVLLRHFSATFMSFAGFTTPVFTALFGWVFLSETISWHFYISFIIVLCGLTIFHRDELKQEVAAT